jgi:CBS domain-containing protein
VFDALKLMAGKSIGALVVTEGERVVGIITERDYARKVILMARSSKETPVRDIMTSSVLHVRRDHTSEECMALMSENRVRHLPVMGQWQARRPHFHRGPGERHYLRTEIHH